MSDGELHGDVPAGTYDLVVHGNVALPDGGVLEGGWLGIAAGQIAVVSETPLNGAEAVEAAGHLVLPGFVDAHVHTRSCVDEGVTATTRAAAAGGTTTIIDMPFDKPDRPVNSLDRFDAKVADVGTEALVDVALYATFPPEGDLGMIAELAGAGAAGFKVSTIEVDPIRFPRIPDGRLYEAFPGDHRYRSPRRCPPGEPGDRFRPGRGVSSPRRHGAHRSCAEPPPRRRGGGRGPPARVGVLDRRAPPHGSRHAAPHLRPHSLQSIEGGAGHG